MSSHRIRVLAACLAGATALTAGVGTAVARPRTSPDGQPTTTTAPTGAPDGTTQTGNLFTGTKGTFDTDTGGWSGNPGILSVVRSPAYSGQGALAVRAPSGAVTNTAALSGSNAGSWTKVNAGWTYRATVELRAATAGRTVQPVLSWFDSRSAPVGYTWGAPSTDGTSWTASVPVTGLAPASAAYVSLGLIWYGTPGGEIHYVDAAALVGTAPHALLGVYDAPFGATGDTTELRDMETWQGKEHAVVGLYTNWEPAEADHLFNEQLPATWAEGSVPMVSWMPWIGNDTSVDYDAQIAGGARDPYIVDWATRMKSFLAGPDGAYGNADDRRVFVRFAHEANGNWYPYSPAWNGSPAASYVSMWRHVHDVVAAQGLDADHLGWVWSVTNDDAYPGPSAEQLYPGDAYVDWIGIDGYNWGNLHEPVESWETPDQVFGPMTARLRALTSKPLSINEVGATTSGRDVPDKAAWITQYFGWASANGVRMTAWFNDYPDLWSVFGGTRGDQVYTAAGRSYAVYSAYRTATQASWLAGSDSTNPRLITDAQFAGV